MIAVGSGCRMEHRKYATGSPTPLLPKKDGNAVGNDDGQSSATPLRSMLRWSLDSGAV